MIQSDQPAGVAVDRGVRTGTGPRTAAAMTATLDACGRLGPEHAALVECCRELERDLAAERERCAVIAEAGMSGTSKAYANACYTIATAIRGA